MATVKKHIRHEQYKQALLEKAYLPPWHYVWRSACHRIYGQHLDKVTFSPFDSKRWIEENEVNKQTY